MRNSTSSHTTDCINKGTNETSLMAVLHIDIDNCSINTCLNSKV